MAFTLYGYVAIIWTVVPSFQMGWHISALNVIQAVLTCKSSLSDPGGALSSYLTPCIAMNDSTFSIVTSMLTVGGLFGSISASYLMNRYGRKGALCISHGLFTSGSAIMSTANGVSTFVAGRFLVGLGAGLGICVVPITLAEIAPPNIRGSVGVLNQVGTVFGILSTQAVGMNYNSPREWRTVLSVSSILSLAGLIIGWVMTESPLHLKSLGRNDEAQHSASKIWKHGMPLAREGETADPLLSEGVAAASQEEGYAQTSAAHAIGVAEVLRTPQFRRPLTIVSLIMISQQISGINAVMYYSTNILSRVTPASATWISLIIAIVNAMMTFPAISLIERLGRRTLLMGSAAGSLITLILVGIGIDFGWTWLAGFSILGFVASFAIGLGPVPFVVISDVSPNRTAGAMATIGLSLNWITNFFVALVFLPLRNFLSGGEPLKEGRVFFVFAVAFSCVFLLFMRLYK